MDNEKRGIITKKDICINCKNFPCTKHRSMHGLKKILIKMNDFLRKDKL